jgi:hypothetical protein
VRVMRTQSGFVGRSKGQFTEATGSERRRAVTSGWQESAAWGAKLQLPTMSPISWRAERDTLLEILGPPENLIHSQQVDNHCKL